MRFLKIILVLPIILILASIILGYFDPDCNYKIGKTLEYIDSGNRSAANYWFDRAAQKGHLGALRQSGIYYLFGFGPQDKEKGARYLKQASDKKDMLAMEVMASAYEYGIGVKQDYKKAASLIEDAIMLRKEKDEGSLKKSYSQLAFIYTICQPPIRNFKRGLKLQQELYESAMQDQNPAEYIGIYHYFGLGVEKDFKKALQFFEEGARLGGAEARAIVGNSYLTGKGAPKDYKLAQRWLNLSAKQGKVYSSCQLAIAYCLGTPEISENANNEQWIDKTIDFGLPSFKYLKGRKFESVKKGLEQIKADAESSSDAGIIYGIIKNTGIETKRDEDLAKKYFDKALKAGNYDAAYIKASNILESPKITRAEAQKGLDLLQLAWENKHQAAGVDLAYQFFAGVYTEQNWSQCYEILSQINLDNSPHGQYLLSLCYQYGLGTERDIKKGLSLNLKAAENGYENAIDWMINDFNSLDNKDKIEVDFDQLLDLAVEAEIPEFMYKKAKRMKDKKASTELLVKAADLGYVKAQLELGYRYASTTYGEQDEAKSRKYYKMARNSGSDSASYLMSENDDSQFQFKRAPESKEVLVTTKDIKVGDKFTRDSFKASKSDFVLDSYLDNEEETIQYLIGKRSRYELSIGKEISIHDVDGESQSEKK